MRHTLHYMVLVAVGCLMAAAARAQHQFKGTSLSEALITLDHSSKRYDISFLYDELEDFTVTKTIRRDCPLPEAVREVCGFYPVKVTVKGRDILVECIQKDRTKLIGRLVDAKGLPVAYANILLFQHSDSTVLGGGVSNEAGDFVIPCSAREARVRVSCVGFRTIERTMPIGNVGTLRMQMANNYLGPVTVSGQVPIIRNETDRMTYIVRNDQFAHELTALELLNRVPMVSVTGGKPSILGKGEAHFMLNGRMVEQGSETIRQKLWSLRAEDIERIEVISVPSGKYQTEASGYINIVLNPAQAEGWRADVSGQGVMNDNWSNEMRKSGYSEQLNASLSYGSQKLDFSLDLHQNYLTGAKRTIYEFSDIDMSKYDLPTTSELSNRRTDNSDNNVGIDAMLRYRPSKRLELGAMASWQSQRLGIDCTESPELWFDQHAVVRGPEPYVSSISELSPVDPSRSISLTTYGDWKLDEKGKKLSLTYNYFHRNSHEKVGGWSFSTYTNLEYYYSEAWTEYWLHDVKLDLTLPFKHFQMDAGLAYNDIKNASNEHGGQYNVVNVVTTDFNYRERTAAGYLTLQRDFLDKRLSAKVGVRFERAWLEGTEEPFALWYSSHVVRKSEENNRSYNELLPTLHLSYRPGGRHQLSLAYGIGINRQNLHDLNPLRFYTTKTNYTSGNPALFHGKTRSLELSYSNGRGLQATAYHLEGDNQVDWITEFYADRSSVGDKEAANLLQMNYPINCTNYKKTGISMRYQHQFSRLLSATAEGEGYYYDAEAPFSTVDVVGDLIKPFGFPTYTNVDSKTYTPDNTIYAPAVYGWAGRLALSGDLFLNQKHTWMVSARYDQWLKDYQGMTRYDAYGYFSFAVRCSLMRDRLKLSLVATDPFHQYVTNAYREFGANGRRSIYDRALYDEFIHTNYHISSLSLTATYSLFNHTKIKYSK